MKQLIIAMFLLLASFQLNSGDDDFVSIFSNHDVVVEKVTYEDIRRLFTLVFNKWDNGAKVNIILRNSDSPIHREFLWEFLGITPTRYQEIIDSHVSSGRAKQPIITKSETETISKISNVPGSVGYLSNLIVITNYDSQIKILIVE